MKVHPCGICRTDLLTLDGGLAKPTLPLVIGHEIVGTVVSWGSRSNYAMERRQGRSTLVRL